MKIKGLKILPVVAAVSILAGCVVLSVYPFYTAKDLVFDPGLAGRWGEFGSTNEFWRFTASGAKSYAVAIVDANSTNNGTAHLFRLKQYQFLDFCTTNRQDFQLPLHHISKVTRQESDLTMSFMDYGWLAHYLETNPAALRHIVVLENPDDPNSGKTIYLTADTKELQQFLLKHAANTNAFNSSVKLKRLPQ